jgi:hypothetical protein
MAHRVGPSMEAMEGAPGETRLDHVFTQADGEELPTSDYSVLASREPRNCHVELGRRPPRSPPLTHDTEPARATETDAGCISGL